MDREIQRRREYPYIKTLPGIFKCVELVITQKYCFQFSVNKLILHRVPKNREPFVFFK